MYYDKDGDLKPGKKGDVAKLIDFYIPCIRINKSMLNVHSLPFRNILFTGICLTMQQWRKFMEVVEEVDKVAKAKC